MSSNSSTSRLFDGTALAASATAAGYCEAKGSGACAFDVSKYSFDITLDLGEGGVKTVATVSGTVGTGRDSAAFAKVSLADAEGPYVVDRKMTPGSNPSFKFVVKAR